MAMIEEFPVGALTLRARSMDARRQFHVARRLAGLLERAGELAPLLAGVDPGKLDEAAALKVAGAIGQAVGSLADEQVDYILDACLDTVEVRQDGGGWAPLRARGVLMYPLDLPTLLTITGRVLWANLAGFTSALPALGGAMKGVGQASSG